jgi:hypothetical protein
MYSSKVERPPMTQTQTNLEEATLEFINELVDENYYDGDIFDFIEKYGEDNFVNYYVNYVDLGEEYAYDAVEAFIEEFGIEQLNSFTDAYRGRFSSKGEYAEEMVRDCYSINAPTFLEIDWEATFDNLDCVYQNGYVFDTCF